jgi:cytidine deaminase
MVKLSIINRAIKEAKNSDVVRGKVGAVLFTNSGHIITSAHNTVFLGKMSKKIFTIHAERFLLIKALKLKARERFGKNDKLNVFVLRYKVGDDTIANAKPCGICQSYLKIAGVRVFYTNDKGNIEKLEKQHDEHKRYSVSYS